MTNFELLNVYFLFILLFIALLQFDKIAYNRPWEGSNVA